MAEQMRITAVRLVAAPRQEAQSGLLGWVSCTLNGALRLDSIALRRTADGRRTISFPHRHDSAGRKHFYLRPLTDAVRREIEGQILEALGLREVAQL